MLDTIATIRKGDYICSDFASFIQGTVVGMGTLGKRIPAYKIETPDGRIEFIIKGQAKLLITPEEKAQGCQILSRHD